MADHRYQSDEELVRWLKHSRVCQQTLAAQIAETETRLAKLRRDLGNAQQRAKWIAYYLAQPEAARSTACPDIGFDGDLT